MSRLARHRRGTLSRHPGVALLRHPPRIPRIRPRHHHGDERLCAPDHAALSVAHRGPAAAGRRQGAPPYRPFRRRADERRGGLRTADLHGAVGPGRRRHQHDDGLAPLRLSQAPRLRHGRHLDRRFGHHRRRGDDLALDRSRDVSRPRCRRSTCAASAPAAARSPTFPRSPVRCASDRAAPARDRGRSPMAAAARNRP